jgi:UDP-3-O-[3-hydroxymyristoyl] glucosamine N-acyltransferase
MSEPQFWAPPRPVSLAEVAVWTGGTLADEAAGRTTIRSVGPLDLAGDGDLTFLDNIKYLPQLAQTRATACLMQKDMAEKVPAGVAAIIVAEPYRALALVLAKLYPSAMKPEGVFGGEKGVVSPAAHVHASAVLEPGVTVEPGAVIGARVQIGTGTTICAGAIIGHDVAIGRNCYIGAGVVLLHTLVGNRVILHAGVRAGQDGFGFAMGPKGHLKVPQIGRVVIQDDVEIGANTTIDRGANRDTVIGEGSKIDNLVQIAHNVVIGRHCVIVSQSGISGSTVLGDFVVVAGQAGLTGHLKIGMGAQIGAQAGVMSDVPAGARIVGSPAKPIREFGRELAALKRLAERPGKPAGGKD